VPEHESIAHGVPIAHSLTEVVLTSAVESSILNLLAKWATSKLHNEGFRNWEFEEQRTES